MAPVGRIMTGTKITQSEYSNGYRSIFYIDTVVVVVYAIKHKNLMLFCCCWCGCFVVKYEKETIYTFSVTDKSVLIGIVTQDITKISCVVTCMGFRKYERP